MRYSPEWKGAVEGWTVNHVSRNLWRVESTMQRADVMQEAYLIFLKVVKRYPDVETPQHFQSLYMRSWSNRFTDLSREDSQQRAHEIVPADGFDPIGSDDNDGALMVLIRQAPAEVTMVLNLFLCAPKEILELALASWKGENRRRSDGGSEKICQLLGISPVRDVMAEVEEYFTRT